MGPYDKRRIYEYVLSWVEINFSVFSEFKQLILQKKKLKNYQII